MLIGTARKLVINFRKILTIYREGFGSLTHIILDARKTRGKMR